MLAALLCVTAARAQEMRYVDAAELTLVGKAMPTPQLYHRLDTVVYNDLSDVAKRQLRYSAGLALAFTTDSRTISAEWESVNPRIGLNSTPITQKGLDLYIKQDGQWIYAASGCNAPDKLSHKLTIITGMDATERECLLYLPLRDEVLGLKIGVEETASISAGSVPFRRKVVVLGSSITHGFAASRPGMTYPARMSRDTGIYFINLGISGQCKLQPDLARAIADTEADAFVFDCFSNPSGEEIDELFDGFVARIRASHPDKPLIFVQTIVRDTGNFNLDKRDFESRKRAAAERKMKALLKTDRHAYFIDPGLYTGSDHEGTVDGSHPTDLGFTRIIDNIQPQIMKILGRYGIR